MPLDLLFRQSSAPGCVLFLQPQKQQKPSQHYAESSEKSAFFTAAFTL
jgi:hypothetical protein